MRSHYPSSHVLISSRHLGCNLTWSKRWPVLTWSPQVFYFFIKIKDQREISSSTCSLISDIPFSLLKLFTMSQSFSLSLSLSSTCHCCKFLNVRDRTPPSHALFQGVVIIAFDFLLLPLLAADAVLVATDVTPGPSLQSLHLVLIFHPSVRIICQHFFKNKSRLHPWAI